MSRVKFIDVDYVKRFTTLDDNADSDKIIPYIYVAQDVELQQILGSTFYDRLKEGVIADDLNADELALIQTYIQPMLVWWTLFYATPTLNFKLTNKAISQENSEYSNPSEKGIVDFLRHDFRNIAEFQTKRLVRYLCDYSNLFPEYENPDDKENLHKSNKAYFSGVVIPKKNNNWDKYHKRYE